MSKYFTIFGPVSFAFLLILQTFNNCRAQDMDAVISVRLDAIPVVEISGHFTRPSSTNFAILRNYAGVSDLATRISDLQLEDAAGNAVAFRQFVPGEYVANSEFVSWRYKIDLRPLKQPSTAAHLSWLTTKNGLLVLSDILPIVPATNSRPTAKLRLELPDGWHSSIGGNVVATGDVDRTAVLVGMDLRDIDDSRNSSGLRIVTDGTWKFADDEAAKAADEIYSEYIRLFGNAPAANPSILLVHFPQNTGFGIWEGDTRGSTVTIASSDMPFRTQSIQRLHEQLRHELFTYGSLTR